MTLLLQTFLPHVVCLLLFRLKEGQCNAAGENPGREREQRITLLVQEKQEINQRGLLDLAARSGCTLISCLTMKCCELLTGSNSYDMSHLTRSFFSPSCVQLYRADISAAGFTVKHSFLTLMRTL